MYKADEIKQEFIKLIGWRQNNDPNGVKLVPIIENEGTPEELTTDLTQSETALYYNSFHPLLTIQNLYSIAPDFNKIVDDPTTINLEFSKWLKEKTEDAILEAVNTWIAEKASGGTARNLLDNDTLFKVSGNLTETSELPLNNFVGIEIAPTYKHKGLLLRIRELKVQFEEAQHIEIILYKAGEKDPVKTHQINYNSPGSSETFNLNFEVEANQIYYLGYHTTGIVGRPINGVRNYTFDIRGLSYFPHNRYFTARAISADHAGFLWDLRRTKYSLDTNYGLNPVFDVVCDYTQILIEQRDIFKNLVGYQLAINFLREMAFNSNVRINRNESNMTQAQLIYEIEGDTRGNNKNSLSTKLKGALEAIKLDQKNIISVCLPCQKKGVKYKAIGANGIIKKNHNGFKGY